MITRNFQLYLTSNEKPLFSFNANQYDSGEKWVFTLLTEEGEPYTPTNAAIVGVKPDGNAIAVNGTIENGKVVIMETEQMTAVPGKALFELSLDDLTHGTANFAVNIEKKPIEDAVFSDSDLSLIEEALESTTRVFTVTFESRYFDRWYTTCDKTYAEVKEALEANKPFVAYHRVVPTGYDIDRIPYDVYTEQLPFVRRDRQIHQYHTESFYFFGVPTWELTPQTTSNFTNKMYQTVIELRATSYCDWINVYKEIQTV